MTKRIRLNEKKGILIILLFSSLSIYSALCEYFGVDIGSMELDPQWLPDELVNAQVRVSDVLQTLGRCKKCQVSLSNILPVRLIN